VWLSNADNGDVIVELLKGDLHAEWFIRGADFTPDERLRLDVKGDLINWLEQKYRVTDDVASSNYTVFKGPATL